MTMEQLNERAIVTALESGGGSLQKQTSSQMLSETQTQVPSVIPPPGKDIARTMAIAKIVSEVEVAKACNPALTPQQRDALIRLLNGTGWTVQHIARRGRDLIGRHTFGSIAFEHWKTNDEEAVEQIKARFQCSYCSTEWWGLSGSKCPTCFDQ